MAQKPPLSFEESGWLIKMYKVGYIFNALLSKTEALMTPKLEGGIVIFTIYLKLGIKLCSRPECRDPVQYL